MTQTNIDTGSSKISTLGTVTTGTWSSSATPIDVAHGGSGATSFTAYAPIASGTTGTGVMQSVASVGTATHVLTSNGAGALPSFQAVGAGVTLISQQTASSSATIEFGNVTGYTHYQIFIRDLEPATNNIDLFIRISTDAGSTWKSNAADYTWQRYTATAAASAGARVNTGGQILAGSNLGNAANTNLSGIVDIISPGTSTGFATIEIQSGYLNNSNAVVYSWNAGQYTQAAAINGIQFLCSSGNITAGHFSLYGIK